MRPLLIVGQHNKAFIPLLVKATMTNKVKDVPRCLASAHDPLEIAPGLPFQPSQLDQTTLLQRTDCVTDTPLLLFYVKPGV